MEDTKLEENKNFKEEWNQYMDNLIASFEEKNFCKSTDYIDC